ncbi:MAG: hypothetical protein H6739_36330 [Alphaproteobacteria bacterium]|nr:hypothetical protein [Alphaproteobacteria bacterium]
MRRPLLGLLILGIAGCYPYEDYLADENAATCDWWQRCDMLGPLGYDDVDDCVSEAEGWDAQDPPDCEVYDAGAAKDCVEGLQQMACGEETPEYPAACAQACSAAE